MRIILVSCWLLIALRLAAEKMAWLDNGRIRLGVDLDMGGAVTYLAEAGGSNMINSWDHGREVQLSFYSGPVPFQPPNTTLDPGWKELGWNPIQAGDAFGHGPPVTEWKNDGKGIRVRFVPLIWPLKNVPAECVFDSSYRLNGNAVEVENRLMNARADPAQYPGRGQELPAVYSNGAWYKLVSYTGDQPFTGGSTATLVDKNDGKGWPWLTFYGTEHWAALLNDNNRGIGVFEPDACRFGAGFAGEPKGTGGSKDSQTGYIAPNLDEILDHNITYQFDYALIVGGVDDIRRYAAEHSTRPALPRWDFKSDRQHWTYNGTTDAGWPIKGELRVALALPNACLLSPETVWSAAKAQKFEMDAALAGGGEIQLTAQTFIPANAWLAPLKIAVASGNKCRRYTVDLADWPGYRGSMRRVKLILPQGPGLALFRSVAFK